ncbi:MAG: hypothetical protein NTW19_16540 [Planctomycetota bacterium]|nr:hypothetical protein [Planctomycetota bacterium]
MNRRSAGSAFFSSSTRGWAALLSSGCARASPTPWQWAPQRYLRPTLVPRRAACHNAVSKITTEPGGADTATSPGQWSFDPTGQGLIASFNFRGTTTNGPVWSLSPRT